MGAQEDGVNHAGDLLGVQIKVVIPDLVSERSEAESVRNPGLGVGGVKDEAERYRFMARCGYVYILASQKNGTLYTGVTSDLAGRLEQHETGVGSKFAARYGVKRLVWFDEYEWIVDAIAREKGDQEIAASVEDQDDRGKQSALARHFVAVALTILRRLWLHGVRGLDSRHSLREVENDDPSF